MLPRPTQTGILVGLSLSLSVLISCASGSADLTTRWQVLSQETIGHPPAINSIIFFDELNGVALSALALASTSDGGTHWTERLDGGNRGLYSMRFVDRQKGWIVGAKGNGTEQDSAISSQNDQPLILKTEDGGTTWREIDVEHFLRTKGASFSTSSSICTERSGTAWIAGDAGIVQATIESNELRALNITRTPTAVLDVSCNDSREVWATGADGLIMHHQQQKWAPIKSPEDGAFFVRVKVVGKAVWLVGRTHEKGQDREKGLLLSSDDGNNWENRTPRDAGPLVDLNLVDTQGWLVGAEGSIYHTSNGGTDWRKENSPTKNDLYSVYLLNGSRAWIGGDKLTVLSLKTN